MKSYGVAVYKYQALRVVGHNLSQRISPVDKILHGIDMTDGYVRVVNKSSEGQMFGSVSEKAPQKVSSGRGDYCPTTRA
jgi:hypothetical protein